MFVVLAWFFGAGRGQRALPTARPRFVCSDGSPQEGLGAPACPQVSARVCPNCSGDRAITTVSLP